MKILERKKSAKKFIERWSNRGNEKQHSQSFWLDLLGTVFGIENPAEYILFEDSVKNMMDQSSFIDGYIEKTNVLIEQKGQEKDLNKGIRQSDGSFLTPFQQALRYSASLPYSRRPRWIITCNFKEFYIYDMEKPNSDPSILKLVDLDKEYYRLEILADKSNTQIEKETKVSIQAGELIGQIYEELIQQYNNPDSPETLKSINQLCVRLVFCFYAEDSGLFGKRGMIHDYLQDFEAKFFRNALVELFHVLNIKIENRDPYLEDKLARFPYVNGGLFEDMDLEIPRFTEHLRDLILKNATSEFDWSEISPTIFGSVFESTLNPEERHEGGMHYTSIENIHKVIDPFFLDELKEELNEIKQYKQYAAIKRKAQEFQNKLSSLTFFDPACGSGNFLTETYLSLRELENQALILITKDNVRLDTNENLIKVSLKQFYGIEINDFAVSVAKTALWIAESQMFEKTKDLIYSEIDYLPIKSYANILEGNAIRIDWNKIINKYELSYIFGNPPFLGARKKQQHHTEDMNIAFKGQKGIGDLDYVSAWYKKAAEYIADTDIMCAFVSTNSIVQGTQVALLWENLIEDHGITINFAYHSFVWKSKTINSAAVHCVIIGFSRINNNNKKIFISKEQVELASNINPYLIDAPNTYVWTRTKPLSDVLPTIITGSMPNGKQLVLKPVEKNYIIQKYPEAKQVIKMFVGADEYIKGKERFCLWINSEDLNLVSKIPPIMKRIELVKTQREKSTRPQTSDFLAKIPYAFGENRQPDSDYLLIPETSSENRRYIPIGYVSKDVIASNSGNIIPEASLYHFAILTSNVHMSWMRTVAGRMKSDYRYSATLVYNNFPWPELSDKQKLILIDSGKAIIDARSLYPEMTLAKLYNESLMPPELRKAHQENDKAVMNIYGMDVKTISERDCVEILMNNYNSIIHDLKIHT